MPEILCYKSYTHTENLITLAFFGVVIAFIIVIGVMM